MSRRPKLRSIGIAAAVVGRAPADVRPDHGLGESGRRPGRARASAAAGRRRLLEALQGHEREPRALRRAEAPAEPRAVGDRPAPQPGDGARAASSSTRANVDVYLHGIDWHTWGENVGLHAARRRRRCSRRSWTARPTASNILNRAFRHVAIGTVRVGRDALGHGLLLRLADRPTARPLPVEVLRADVVQELPELLDLFLLVAGDEDRGLRQHVLLREDRHRHPDGERDRVGGPRGDLEGVARCAAGGSWRRTCSRGAR